MAPEKAHDEHELTDEFLRCRTWGHIWDEFNPIDLGPPQYGWRESLRCVRCTTERHRLIAARTGQILSVTYYYADNYQLEAGVGPFMRGPLRNEFFNRMRQALYAANAIADNFEANGNGTKKAAKKVAAARKVTARVTKR